MRDGVHLREGTREAYTPRYTAPRGIQGGIASLPPSSLKTGKKGGREAPPLFNTFCSFVKKCSKSLSCRSTRAMHDFILRLISEQLLISEQFRPLNSVNINDSFDTFDERCPSGRDVRDEVKSVKSRAIVLPRLLRSEVRVLTF